ncbi:DNA-3-methyladenine glycosylase I [Stratiformator vulcanicus]|uniref:DNA-3-methyladenine glycosylase 1 n=1 Tax=Stratiformator vulcanicus TaxID=2527980 RepID=A0A517R0M4_9PLAN|nr:DNA-3-methyladenine glycosylase I [Stratiformator vulcanicus]QDT37421.1 DNA-3-methyladenine glycosylase 1 [Stratiformator vulcanicus]
MEAVAKVVRCEDGIRRCWWCGDDPLYRSYHDEEWGVPVAEDRRLFEKLCLEGFQSGLSWLTILRKRENFRAAFANFEFEKVARFGDRDVDRLLGDAGIVRHRGKIESTINNARRAIELVEECGSLASFVWQFEPQLVPASKWQLRSTCDESKQLSKQLKRRGWKFVGPTTAYAFMQAMGMVNDHLPKCAARSKIEQLRTGFSRPC